MRKSRRWRRFLLGTGLLLAFAISLALVLLRPAALYEHLERSLAEAGLRPSRAGTMYVTPWGGLTIRELQLEEIKLNPSWRISIEVGRVHVVPHWWDFLQGRIRARSVILHQPRVRATYDPSPPPESGEPVATTHRLNIDPTDWPTLRIVNGDVQALRRAPGADQVLRRWLVSGRGAYEPHALTYSAEIRQIGGAGTTGVQDTLLARALVTGGVAEFSGGGVPLDLLRSVLPDAVRRNLDEHRCSGMLRLERLTLGPDGIQALEISVSDAAALLPIDPRQQARGKDPYMAAAGVNARLALRATRGQPQSQAELTLRGDYAGGALAIDVSAPALPLSPAELLRTLSKDRWPTGLALGDWSLRAELRELVIPTEQTAPHLLADARLPSPLRAFFRDYQPVGRGDLRLSVFGAHRTDAQHPSGRWITTAYQGLFEPRGAACTYVHFPYTVTDVGGVVRFGNDGIALESLIGQHGDALVIADGRLADSTQWTPFELRFRGLSVPIDDDLLAALPARYRTLVRRASLDGACDLDVRVTRPRGDPALGNDPPRVELDADLLYGSVALAPEYPILAASGRLHVADERIRIESLSGRLAEGFAQISGWLAADPEQTQHELTIAAAGVNWSRDLPPDVLGPLRFDGTLDLVGESTRTQSVRCEQFAVRTESAAIRDADGALRAEVERASAVYENGAVESLALVGRDRSGATIDVTGEIPAAEEPLAPMLSIAVDAPDAAAFASAWSPPAWRESMRRAGVEGRATVRASVSADASALDRALATDLDVQVERLATNTFPIPLTQIDLSARVTSSDFLLKSAHARLPGGGTISLSGAGAAGPDSLAFRGALRADRVDPLADLQPLLSSAEFGAATTALVGGRVDLDWPEFEFRVSGNVREWHAAGQARVTGLELNVASKPLRLDGALQGEFEADAGGPRIAGDLQVEAADLDGRRFETGSAKLRLADGQLHLGDLNAGFCDGACRGLARFDLRRGGYELGLTLENVSVADLFRLPSDHPRRENAGRFDARLVARGADGSLAERTAAGDLRIHQASLLNAAVTQSVLDATRARGARVDDAVDEATARFTLRGSEMTLERLDVSAAQLHWVGAGRWNTQSDALSGSLIGATPQDAPRLLLVTDVIEWAGGELLAYELAGTLSQPRVQVLPLRRITQPLVRLLEDLRGAAPSP